MRYMFLPPVVVKVTGYWCGGHQTTNVNLVFIRTEFNLHCILPQIKPSRATAQYSTCTTLKTVAVTCIYIVVAADQLNIQDYSPKTSRKRDVSSSNSAAPVAPRYL